MLTQKIESWITNIIRKFVLEAHQILSPYVAHAFVAAPMRLIVFAGILQLTSASHAHHSTTYFDSANELVFTNAVISQLTLDNPHAQITFWVHDKNGKRVKWRCELNSGTMLRNSGWSEGMFNQGEKYEIRGYPSEQKPYTCRFLSAVPLNLQN